MRRLVFLLLLAIALVIVLGLYLNWFSFAQKSGDESAFITTKAMIPAAKCRPNFPIGSPPFIERRRQSRSDGLADATACGIASTRSGARHLKTSFVPIRCLSRRFGCTVLFRLQWLASTASPTAPPLLSRPKPRSSQGKHRITARIPAA